MRARSVFAFVSFVVAASVVALAQDPVKVDPAHYKVLIDNAAVRVLKVTYPPGSKSVMHQHPDSMVIALANAKVKFNLPDGTSQDAEFANESATYTAAGKHSPTNTGTNAVDAILVEFKGAAPGKAALPASRPGMTLKTMGEGPRATAYRSTMAANFSEPAGSKHDFDQVVIALAPTQMSLSIDGKPAKTTWKRGDVAFIGRGVPHESKNTSGKPQDLILVAIK
jgi:quercetin dioxygenase-like cupin family protein